MPQSYAKVVRHLEEWKSFRARSREWEAEVVGRSGEVVPFEVHSTPVYEQRGLKYVVIIARNISERKSLEERLRSNYAELETKIGMLEQESQEKLREMKEEFNRLSGRILEDQERERHAIGRELHDEMGGYLTILGIYLGKMAKEPGNRAWQDQFTQAFDEMVQYIRSLSHSLYPVMLERGDLLSALMTYFENFQRRIGVKIDFKYRGLKERLPSHIEAVAYRIIQEALTNVAKHAAAQNVKVTIFRLKSVVKLSVEDDGRGFDLSRTRTEGAYGISGMKNRALFAGGNLEVESSPGRGTRVVSTLPVSSNG
jgi:signal transduction histidine kinase